MRKQTSAQAREAAKAADAAQLATIKEREAQAEQRYAEGRYADALDRYQVLADQGSGLAQRRLGDVYLNGKGVPRDAAEKGRPLVRSRGGKMTCRRWRCWVCCTSAARACA